MAIDKVDLGDMLYLSFFVYFLKIPQICYIKLVFAMTAVFVPVENRKFNVQQILFIKINMLEFQTCDNLTHEFCFYIKPLRQIKKFF